MLTQRLDTLVEHGVMAREPYQEKPVRYDYRLTEKGRELGLVDDIMTSDEYLQGRKEHLEIDGAAHAGAPSRASATSAGAQNVPSGLGKEREPALLWP